MAGTGSHHSKNNNVVNPTHHKWYWAFNYGPASDKGGSHKVPKQSGM